jgi:L-cysteine:1D-myo-inositol 2-amino-2-deoxy-alpha-D-glucopyranoside ligase
MKPWPNLEIPPVKRVFPELKLKSTWGEPLNRQAFICYVCGITPYDATHLGHAATYITFDLINRYQVLRNRKLNFIENVTDVDDPLLERANRDKVDWRKLAKSQSDLFERDMTALHILPPNTYLSVSETIDLVIKGMAALEASNLIYSIEGDVYYDINSHLQELPLDIDSAIKIFSERGGDPDRVGKRHKLDPILWRRNVPGEPGWESPYGFGRPGWHIECSVIAIHGAGTSSATSEPILDLQGGGSDLIFPHHFMTKIISEDISGRVFASEYVHTGLIGLDGEKMSKSRGNLVFVHKLLNEGIDAMCIRLALMSGKYSQDRAWSQELLSDSINLLERIKLCISRTEVADTKNLIDDLIEALSNDLDTPKCIHLLDSWCEETLKGGIGGNPGELSRFLDSALGLAV